MRNNAARSLADIQQPPIEDVLPFWKNESVSSGQLEMFIGSNPKDDQYYPLLWPTYRVDDSGTVHLGPCRILVRRSWKVHGTSDTAQGLCTGEPRGLTAIRDSILAAARWKPDPAQPYRQAQDRMILRSGVKLDRWGMR